MWIVFSRKENDCFQRLQTWQVDKLSDYLLVSTSSAFKECDCRPTEQIDTSGFRAGGLPVRLSCQPFPVSPQPFSLSLRLSPWLFLTLYFPCFIFLFCFFLSPLISFSFWLFNFYNFEGEENGRKDILSKILYFSV